MRHHQIFTLLIAAGLAACSNGSQNSEAAADGNASKASTPDSLAATAVREVEVVLSEFSFATSDTVFQAGVPYRFVFRNEGREPHEWAVVPRGDEDEGNLLFEVEEDELPSGATLVREFTFAEPGLYDFACYMPGHYDGGMVLPVRVVAGG